MRREFPFLSSPPVFLFVFFVLRSFLLSFTRVYATFLRVHFCVFFSLRCMRDKREREREKKKKKKCNGSMALDCSSRLLFSFNRVARLYYFSVCVFDVFCLFVCKLASFSFSSSSSSLTHTVDEKCILFYYLNFALLVCSLCVFTCSPTQRLIYLFD